MTRKVSCVDTSNAGAEVDAKMCSSAHPVKAEEKCNEQPCTSFSWGVGEWGDCSAPCGGGVQYRDVLCQTGGSTVDDSYCASVPGKPLNTDPCNNNACTQGTFHWVTGPWGKCDARCGTGSRERNAACRDWLGNTADITNCDMGSKPSLTGDCNTQTCDDLHRWEVCGWEECTATCGGAGGSGGLMSGVTARQVTCLDKNNKMVDDALCSSIGAKPTSLLVGCNPQPCDGNNWMTTTWTRCNPDTKLRIRTRHCHSKDGGNVDDSECPQDKAPKLEEKCDPNVCPVGANSPGGGGNISGSAVTAPHTLLALVTVVAGAAVWWQ